MAQIKDFVRKYCAQTQLSKELVNTVAEDFVKWISESLLTGEDVRLPELGKFKIQPNSYSRSGLMKNGASLHYHEFRPSFRFRPTFRKECDNRADDIRKGLKGRLNGKPLRTESEIRNLGISEIRNNRNYV